MKAWYKSKTLWFNLLTLAILAGQGQLGIEIPPSIAVPLVTVGNMLLRVITTAPLAATDQP